MTLQNFSFPPFSSSITPNKHKTKKKENKPILENQNEEIPFKMTLNERFDFTDRLSFTIDNKSTRMRDDAISYKKLNKDIIEIGIHCSDFILDLDPDPIQLQSLTSMTREQLTTNYRNKSFYYG